MNWIDECANSAAALTRPQRQRVLNLVLAGVTLGDAAWVEGVSLAAVCGIVDANISTGMLTLNREAA